MKPVLILQNLNMDGPAYLGTWLKGQGLPFEVFNTEAGQDFPRTLDRYGALALLGGEMSANDPLPSLRQAEQLFLQAVRDGVPAIGHCLGGQLMAKALGAAVTRLPTPEIGWHAVDVHDKDLAMHWLGEAKRPTVFQWHCESFGLPPGAQWLASSAACPSQAFAIGPHLAMQWHVELDLQKLSGWSREASVQDDRAAELPPTVQTASAMHQGAKQHLAQQQALADHIYGRWLQPLRGV